MHPFVKILTLIAVLLMMNLLDHWQLFGLCIVVCVVAAKLQFHQFLAMIRRMRLFFISILLVYLFSTPGEIIEHISSGLSPTYEGLHLGLVQIQKLLIALAALCVLLSVDSKEKLMLGLYVFLSPLKVLGLDVERFTARLLLTFDYVEELACSKNNTISFMHLDRMHEEVAPSLCDKVIVLETQAYRVIDQIILIGLVGLALLFIGLKIWS